MWCEFYFLYIAYKPRLDKYETDIFSYYNDFVVLCVGYYRNVLFIEMFRDLYKRAEKQL